MGKTRIVLTHKPFPVETPPRAWGRLVRRPHEHPKTRNTPTSVGKTKTYKTHFRFFPETPPRAWGRLSPSSVIDNTRRKHPHERGEDVGALQQVDDGAKHPHERGEDVLAKPLVYSAGETPPRAWGRLTACYTVIAKSRNTPTSVGKTVYLNVLGWGGKKHPHERGEDPTCGSRTRTSSGNTPTSVGKTSR